MDVEIKDIDLFQTLVGIDYMKHAIGYERTGKRVHLAYRNYYDNGNEKNEIWELLITKGLAVKTNKEKGYYKVSKRGIKFLEKLLNIKIRESK